MSRCKCGSWVCAPVQIFSAEDQVNAHTSVWSLEGRCTAGEAQTVSYRERRKDLWRLYGTESLGLGNLAPNSSKTTCSYMCVCIYMYTHMNTWRGWTRKKTLVTISLILQVCFQSFPPSLVTELPTCSLLLSGQLQMKIYAHTNINTQITSISYLNKLLSLRTQGEIVGLGLCSRLSIYRCLL